MKYNRTSIGALMLSGAALVGLASYEGYRDKAYVPVPGDVPTIGFGTTEGVKMGDTIDPVRALQRAMKDAGKYEGALKNCVVVPLHQYEYDAYVSLSYNIGTSAFCNSTLVKKLNKGLYEEACVQILVWDKFKGQALRGLTIRRQAEYQKCIGN
jgi:lysozyme